MPDHKIHQGGGGHTRDCKILMKFRNQYGVQRGKKQCVKHCENKARNRPGEKANKLQVKEEILKASDPLRSKGQMWVKQRLMRLSDSEN